MDEYLPYLDPDLPIERRVADLVGRMTLPEKAGQMMQLDARGGVDSLINDFHVGSILHTSPRLTIEAHRLTAHTRLRIPLLIGEDAIHGHSFWEGATIFPTQLGMAAGWDPQAIERAARVTAVEVAATGVHWTFSPVLCITRDQRWGRVGETFGEDPYLLGELGAAMVRGYQGAGLADKTAILATAKHFAGYSETQGGRDASEADISHRKLRCWFLPPFERVAREGCATFMLGYQTMDGIPITINDWLLSDVLRGEWGYRGTLITDWDNVGRMVWEQKIMPDYTQASAAALRAGNDMVMTTPRFFEGIQEAVAQGLVTEELLDDAVARILTLKFRLGLFEDPRPPRAEVQRAVINCAEHQQVNLEVARQSLVLLQNNDLLPLQGEQAQRIAVIGPNAHDPQTQLGDWAGNSGQVDWMPDGHPRELIETVFDGLRDLAPTGWEVRYAQGAEILRSVPDPAGETFPDGQPRPQILQPAPVDPALLEAAIDLARDSDVVVAVVGDCIGLIGEALSTATLELFGAQRPLLDALAATGKPMIVVVLASKPHILPPSARSAAAILWAANPGMRGGRALAELIYGQIEPSGRLPLSWPEHVGQQPVYYNLVRGQHGDRYADLTQRPAFAFGEGMSYTTVEYADLRLEKSRLSSADTAVATVTLRNTGQRPAVETVQAYISDLVTTASWAEQELKGFRRVGIEPGEEVQVRLELPVSDWTIVNANGRRVVERGEFELRVGPSSRAEDLLSVTATVF
ncbi:MAG: glycoside hydrolase family 3 N-terminal domain-containing protein [Candidatus Nanopelagicales bacterium]